MLKSHMQYNNNMILPMQYKKCNRVECVVREKKQRFLIKVK